MCPAHLTKGHVQPSVPGVAVTPQRATVVLAQQVLDDAAAPTGGNAEDGDQSGHHHPQPPRVAALRPAGFVRVGHWRRGQRGLHRGDRLAQDSSGGLAQPIDATGRQGGVQHRATHVRYLAPTQAVLTTKHRHGRLEPWPEGARGHLGR